MAQFTVSSNRIGIYRRDFKSWWQAVALSAIACGCLAPGSGQAQRLRDIRFELQQVDVTQEAVLQIALDKSGSTVWCGLKLDFGNGNTRDVRVGDKGESDLQLRINYRYPNAGLYTVRVAGTRMVRGLNSAGACEGGERSVQIRVTDMGVAAAPAPLAPPAPPAPQMPAALPAALPTPAMPTSTATAGMAYPTMPQTSTAPTSASTYPSMPSMPSMPSTPSMPSMPSMAAMPAMPAMPSGPGGSSYPSSDASPPAYPGGMPANTSSFNPGAPQRLSGGATDCGPNPTVECASKALGEAVGKLKEVFSRNKKPADSPAPSAAYNPGAPPMAPSLPGYPAAAVPAAPGYPSAPGSAYPSSPTPSPSYPTPPPPPPPQTPSPSPTPMPTPQPMAMAPAQAPSPSAPAPAAATGRVPEGLYLMTRMWAGSGLEMATWFFSGSQFAREPRMLGARFDFTEAERAAPGTTGKLMLRGDQMTLEGPGFKLRQARIEPKDSGCFYWDAGLFCPVKVAPGPKTYNGTFSGSLGNAAASSSMSLTLSADGRYELRRTGATQTAGMFGGASGSESGRYDFTGSTLRLTPSTGGTPRMYLAFPYDDGSSGPAPRRLYVGGFMLKQQ